MAHPPIIITGMHRSGTSMVTSLFAKAGLMIGKDLDQNHESIFFYNINETLLEMQNATWDHPKTFTQLEDKTLQDYLVLVENNMKRKGTIRYMGIYQWIKTRSNITRLNQWGWKDPRNTITWPLWKTRFPTAKIIHVVRNPIDVAISIHKRERYKKKMVDERDTKGVRIKKYSERMQNFSSALELWCEYEDEAYTMINTYPSDVVVVKYEEMLLQPLQELEKVFGFLKSKKLSVKGINVNRIEKERAYAFLNNSEYKEHYESMKSNIHVCRHGYDKLVFS